MPPTFKKSKEVGGGSLGGRAPALPALEPTDGPHAPQDDSWQLLVELGLADEAPAAQCSARDAAPSVPAAAAAAHNPAKQRAASPPGAGDTTIAAYYRPSVSQAGSQSGGCGSHEALKARVGAAQQLLSSQPQLDDAARAQVLELLQDQQHQIDLLLRGHGSLKASMGELRRSSKEHEQREHKYSAALRDMEDKLARAIRQVGQLQQSTADREEAAAAAHQQALTAARQECAQLQAALASKDQALREADMQLQQHKAQLAAEEQGRSACTAQLSGLASDCASALEESAARAAALDAASFQVQQLKEQAAAAAAARQALEAQLQAATEQNEEAALQAQQRSRDLEAQLAAAQAQLQHAQSSVSEKAALGAQLADKEARLAVAERASKELQWRLAALQTDQRKAQRAAAATIDELRADAAAASSKLRALQANAERQVAAARAEAAAQVGAYRQRWQVEFDRRRSLQNQLIEARGNIRVLARIRPLLEKERTASSSSSGGGGSDAGSVLTAVDESTLCLQLGPGAAAARSYEFDRVFGPSEGQAAVFDEVRDVAVSILDGFSACVLAYGQTGSGKSFTMEGQHPDAPGINARALTELFALAAERAPEITYELSASVLEVYNEQMFDLLAGSKAQQAGLEIKDSPRGGLCVPNLQKERVGSPEDVAVLVQRGKQNRSTFATNMNEHSSRSHLVLTVFATATRTASSSATTTKGALSWSSKLHLIDLAGCERVSRSGAEGERLKEAAAINRSLSALGDVVAALQERRSHVPFRNSKLTRLLEDSLGGSSKTLLVVTCSPAAENCSETKAALEFAARARQVELGAAVSAATAVRCSLDCSSSSDPAPASPTSGGSSSTATAFGRGSPSGSPRVSHTRHSNDLRQQAISRRSSAAPSSSSSSQQGGSTGADAFRLA